jgi:hypothetical protein
VSTPVKQDAEPRHVSVIPPTTFPHLADGRAELVFTRHGLMVRVVCHLHDWKALRTTTADLDCPGCLAAEQIVRDGKEHDSLI